ncbi:MAG: UDP-N-acetylmuramate dehydrogenase [Acidobacteriota bacterium]|mgnify:CR=1 FL=1|nr:UDP-N-acetylmuramate dehydrogenase [Acidobacteriota bacterium]
MSSQAVGGSRHADLDQTDRRLRAAFGDRVGRQVPLGELTTFRTGGAAEWLVETPSPDDIVTAACLTRDLGMPLTVLGGGSNVLVGDGGVRGLVLRIRHGAIGRVDAHHVRADSGVTINGLVRWTVRRGLGGLERWAGTPGTVGGGIRGNAHFDDQLLGDIVAAVGLVDRAGHVARVSTQDMGFDYDESRVQHTGELVLWAEFEVAAGAVTELRAAARRSLAFRKRTQPLDRASAGCVFQNPRPDDGPLPDGVPRSAGALIDLAGLKGHRVGAAAVSPVHANFIVNEGGASARDVRALIERCRASVRERFGLVLRDELMYLGEFEIEGGNEVG